MNRSDRQINHPGRKQALQCIKYHCTAATPPSKGGESYSILSCHKTTHRLTAMHPTPLGDLGVGEAGVLAKAVDMLKGWAENN